MSSPARFPNGVTNVNPTDPLNAFTAPDPTKTIMWWDDFHNFTAGDWTVTETEAASTQAVSTGANGGVLLLTHGVGVGTTDVNQIQNPNETFKLIAGKKTWIKTRFALTAATMANFGAKIGLAILDTTAVAGVTDGFYFRKATGAATLEFVIEKDSAETTTGTIATLTTATFVTVAAYYNGKDAIEVWVDGVKSATITTLTNLPDDEELSVTIAAVNATAAAANVLSCDYLLIASER